MGKITELTVSRGQTRRLGDAEEWIREEYSLKAVIDDEAEVEAARAHMLGLIEGWLSQPAKPTVAFKPANIFSKELADLLSFEEKGEWIVITPRQYLGSENFAKIATIVRDHGGEYISQGRQSHFRIPK
ncbi:MAG: hypothetical protein QHH12_04915 [Candidatus Bathyarchaeota archaeon]|jgi:hypothetical protein|nr:hypothetical protein [Candidatus Bathyarchaeota archaeon A05DMB-3]MDH7607091.1 hypothetical protein [Candidatus Bathyarchaeota archaeon]